MEQKKSAERPHLGSILKKLMTERRYTQNELAQAIGVSTMLIWRIIQERDFNSKYIWKLSEVFGVNLFAMLAQAHPVQTPTEKEIELQQQIIDLQRRIDIYKEIVQGKVQ